MGFSIHTIQVDNGSEFVNDDDRTNRESRFELAVREKGQLCQMHLKQKVSHMS